MKSRILAVSVFAAALMGSSAFAQSSFLDVGRQEPITILINSSPWYGGFEAVVDMYVEQTGNEVNLDTTPYTGMLEKARNAVRTANSPYDILNIDKGWTVEFYEADTLRPLSEVVPNYDLPEQVITCGDSYYWNAEKGFRTRDGGTLMSAPPNCNVHVLAYRSDLMPKAPGTYDELLTQCQQVQDRPNLYGFATRGDRGSVFYDSLPFLLSYGADVVANAEAGDYTVTINSPEALAGFKMYMAIQKECGPANVAALGQSDVIQLMAAGNAVMAQTVIAAWSNYVDPTKSAVVDKVAAAPVPEGPKGRGDAIGNWHLSVPRNIPDSRAEAAMAFIQWFLTKDAQLAYAKAGGIPVRTDVFDELQAQPEFAWMVGYRQTLDSATQVLGFREGAAVEQVMGLKLNQVLIGEKTPEQALNEASAEIEAIFAKSGRKTGRLPDLTP